MTPATKASIEEAKQVVYKELSQRPINVLLQHRRLRKGGDDVDLISVHEDTTLEEALEILRDNGILAIPVYRTADNDPLGKVYTGKDCEKHRVGCPRFSSPCV